MSVQKLMDKVETYLDYTNSYFKDLRQEFEVLETDYINDINKLEDEKSQLEEQNELLEEDNMNLRSENTQLKLEIVDYLLLISQLKENVDI
jgi:hypothetical protein